MRYANITIVASKSFRCMAKSSSNTRTERLRKISSLATGGPISNSELTHRRSSYHPLQDINVCKVRSNSRIIAAVPATAVIYVRKAA